LIGTALRIETREAALYGARSGQEADRRLIASRSPRTAENDGRSEESDAKENK
jgi:hypothetical protein